MRALLLLLAFLFHSPLISAADGPRPWKDYRTILWMGGSVQKNKERWPVMFERLREMGINTAMVGRDDDPKPFIDAGFGYYVENIINKGLCLKFSSSVTNWSKFIDEWMKTRDEKAFVRDYSFDDSAWRESVFDVMRKAARHHAPFGPVAYDLRDELSVTISANPFDYDFSPTALAGFREWLKTQYASLAALNEQWETDFPAWDAVMPFSTDRIKARMVTGERMPKGPPDWSKLKDVKFDPAQAGKNPTRWNFSPWCDHRTYMDISLARMLDDLRQEARKHDPQTPVGIEGTQMASAFGGYDLWRLSQAVDWMEPYDVCNAREILASFMPGKPMMSTVFETNTNAAQRRLWHLMLLGDRGCIVWWSEDTIDWTKPDLPLTAKGHALAPVLKQMTSPLAKLFMLAEKEYDPIAIHYSQPSIQVAWLLESVADGKTWPRRFSSFEGTHNKHAQVRNGALKLFQDLGYSPRFISDRQIEPVPPQPFTGKEKVSLDETDWAWVIAQDRFISDRQIEPAPPQPFTGKEKVSLGEIDRAWVKAQDKISSLQATRTRLLVYPGAWALGGLHDSVFRLWGLRRLSLNVNGLQVGLAGIFDEHGTLNSSHQVFKPDHPDEPLAEAALLWGRTAHFPDRIDLGYFVRDYPLDRLKARVPLDTLAVVSAFMKEREFPTAIRVPPSARVMTHRYKLGTSRLLAFERNIEWKMSEDLKQAGGNAELEKPVTFTAEWDEPAEVVDLWTGKRLGRTNKVEVHLDPWRPSLYALMPVPVEGDVVAELLKEAASAK